MTIEITAPHVLVDDDGQPRAVVCLQVSHTSSDNCWLLLPPEVRDRMELPAVHAFYGQLESTSPPSTPLRYHSECEFSPAVSDVKELGGPSQQLAYLLTLLFARRSPLSPLRGVHIWVTGRLKPENPTLVGDVIHFQAKLKRFAESTGRIFICPEANRERAYYSNIQQIYRPPGISPLTVWSLQELKAQVESGSSERWPNHVIVFVKTIPELIGALFEPIAANAQLTSESPGATIGRESDSVASGNGDKPCKGFLLFSAFDHWTDELEKMRPREGELAWHIASWPPIDVHLTLTGIMTENGPVKFQHYSPDEWIFMLVAPVTSAAGWRERFNLSILGPAFGSSNDILLHLRPPSLRKSFPPDKVRIGLIEEYTTSTHIFSILACFDMFYMLGQPTGIEDAAKLKLNKANLDRYQWPGPVPSDRRFKRLMADEKDRLDAAIFTSRDRSLMTGEAQGIANTQEISGLDRMVASLLGASHLPRTVYCVHAVQRARFDRLADKFRDCVRKAAARSIRNAQKANIVAFDPEHRPTQATQKEFIRLAIAAGGKLPELEFD